MWTSILINFTSITAGNGHGEFSHKCVLCSICFSSCMFSLWKPLLNAPNLARCALLFLKRILRPGRHYKHTVKIFPKCQEQECSFIPSVSVNHNEKEKMEVLSSKHIQRKTSDTHTCVHMHTHKHTHTPFKHNLLKLELWLKKRKRDGEREYNCCESFNVIFESIYIVSVILTYVNFLFIFQVIIS